MTNKSFEEKVRSLSAREMVMTMVEGLEKPAVEVDMATFGTADGGKCFGCAATNAICLISGHVFGADEIRGTGSRGIAINTDWDFLSDFEAAIDRLRRGRVAGYNLYASYGGFVQLKEPDYELPVLTTENYRDHLDAYRKFAEEQD